MGQWLLAAGVLGWATAVREANRALAAGRTVRWVTSAEVSSPAAGAPRPGDFVIVGNSAPHPSAVPLDGAALGDVRTVALSRVRVVIYGGGGAPFHHAAIFRDLDFELDFVNDADIRAGALDHADVIVFPGGGWRAMAGQLDLLGVDGAQAVAGFVRRGGLYMGSCAGSFNPALVSESFAEACPPQRCLRMINARVWNDGPAWGGLASPGIGRLVVENVAPDHPVMLGMPRVFDMVHYNGPVFETVDGAVPGASRALGLAALRRKTDAFTPAERFLSAGGAATTAAPVVTAARPADQTLVDAVIEAGALTVVTGNYGAGWVLLFGSHPEFGEGMTLTRYGTPARMLANAVLWQGARRPRTRHPDTRPSVQAVEPVPVPANVDVARRNLDELLQRIGAQVADLVSNVPFEGESAPTWLQGSYSLSMFGLPPATIWRQTLVECGQLVQEAHERWARVIDRYKRLRERRDVDAAVLRTVERWLWFRRADIWGQDAGFQGVEALAHEASRQLDLARRRISDELPPPTGRPYDFVDCNPYHLAVGSYLSAAGNVANLVLLLRCIERELEAVP